MGGSREAIVEAGQWIARERGKRFLRGKPLSTPALARLFNTHIRMHKMPVKAVHQQEISNLENATLDKGPKRIVPWINVLIDFMKGGELDVMLAASNTPVDAPELVTELWAEKDIPIRNPDGERVGTLVWKKR